MSDLILGVYVEGGIRGSVLRAVLGVCVEGGIGCLC